MAPIRVVSGLDHDTVDWLAMNSLFPRESIRLDDEVWHVPDWLTWDEQVELLDLCRGWLAPPAGAAHPRMLNGTFMSVSTVCLGWYWHPYRYSRFLDDTTGEPVKPFPNELAELARRAINDTYGQATSSSPDAATSSSPDAAIINRYANGAKMGMHQDNEEREDSPVISISLGASCNFRFGNNADRNKPWTDIELRSGDLFVFGGSRRRSFHGVSKVLADGSPLTDPGERINITIRTVQ